MERDGFQLVGCCALVAPGSPGWHCPLFLTCHPFSGVSPGCWALFTPPSLVLVFMSLSQLKISWWFRLPAALGKRSSYALWLTWSAVAWWSFLIHRVQQRSGSSVRGRFWKGLLLFVSTLVQAGSSHELRNRQSRKVHGVISGQRLFTCPPPPSWNLSVTSCHTSFPSGPSKPSQERTLKWTAEWETPSGCLRQEFFPKPSVSF